MDSLSPPPSHALFTYCISCSKTVQGPPCITVQEGIPDHSTQESLLEPSYDTSSQLPVSCSAPYLSQGYPGGFSSGPPSRAQGSGWPMSDRRPEPVFFQWSHTVPWCQVLRAAPCPTGPTRWRSMGGRTEKAVGNHLQAVADPPVEDSEVGIQG